MIFNLLSFLILLFVNHLQILFCDYLDDYTIKIHTFLFHKESKRKFGGMYTRRSPRPFIMVGYKDHIGEKKKQLLKTKYYDKLNNEEYGILNSKRKRKNAKNRESN